MSLGRQIYRNGLLLHFVITSGTEKNVNVSIPYVCCLAFAKNTYLYSCFLKVFVQEKRLEVELFRHESSECARLQQIEVERPKIALMKKVMSKQVIDDAIIKELMDREWTVITDSGVLDNIVPDHQQQEEIKQFFIRNFVELTDMYKFYSAINSGGKTHTLEYIELCKFITETGILDEKDSNVILKVFLESHIRGIGGRDAKSKPSIHSEICQTEFVSECLFCFDCALF